MKNPANTSRLHPEAWEDVLREHPEIGQDLAGLVQPDGDNVVSLVGIYALLQIRSRAFLSRLWGHAESDEASVPSGS